MKLEPVEYQRRVLIEGLWTDWEKCSKQTFDTPQKSYSVPSETRALCAIPEGYVVVPKEDAIDAKRFRVVIAMKTTTLSNLKLGQRGLGDEYFIEGVDKAMIAAGEQ